MKIRLFRKMTHPAWGGTPRVFDGRDERAQNHALRRASGRATLARTTLISSPFLWIVFSFVCAPKPSLAQVVAAPEEAVQAAPGNPNQPGQQAGQPANPGQTPAQPVSVTNIEDKQFQAAEATFQDGKLTVKSDPPQSVPLDELQKATYVHPTQLALEWIGQEPRDLTQVGAVGEPNGVQDVHLRATGLTAKPLKQIAIVCKPLFRVWRLDVSQSPHWKIAVERVGLAAAAELYIEPPLKDLFEQELQVTLTFDDNSTATGTIKAAGHTSDQATTSDEDPSAPARRLATISLAGGDTLRAFLGDGAEDELALQTSWQPNLRVPASQVRGVLFDAAKPEAKTKFDERFAHPGEDDYLLVESRDGGLAEINGKLLGLNSAGVKIAYEGQDRSIKLERIQGIVFAGPAESPAWKGPYQVFRMASGDTLSAAWLTQSDKALQVKSAWGKEIDLPRQAVVEIAGKNTKMVNLSELTPLAVEQTPYFDRLMPWVRDKSWNDRPLKLDGKTYGRGLALHSRCVLTYDLAGEFVSFRAVLGIDDEAGERGHASCKIIVDGQDVFTQPQLRAGQKPVPVEVAVKGAQQLKIEVDFGEGQDVGDRVLWANARLYRE
jgi:hypothetical protein